MVELPQNPLKHLHHWKQWSGGLKAFYGDDLSCRSTHKQGLDVNIRFPCSNPRRLHCSDYTALIIDHTSIQKVAQHLHRQSAGLMPYLPSWGYFSPNKRERPLEGERLRAGWRAVEGEVPTGWQACRGWFDEGRKTPYNVLTCIPTNLVCTSLFLICTKFVYQCYEKNN